jgi:hypothetical protein
MIKDFKKAADASREMLLSFRISEHQLNRRYGSEVLGFLNRLKKQGLRFQLSRPLPRCMFGPGYQKARNEFKLPEGCFECRELFSVDNKGVNSCEPVGEQGPPIEEAESREEIWQQFNSVRQAKSPPSQCRACKYYRRRQCDGLCLRTI